jgi:hypothetical protein
MPIQVIERRNKDKKPTFAENLNEGVGRGLDLAEKFMQEHQAQQKQEQQQQNIANLLGPEYKNLPPEIQKLAAQAKFSKEGELSKLQGKKEYESKEQDIIGRLLRDEDVSKKEFDSLPADKQLSVHKILNPKENKKTQASQPIDEDQLKRIKDVRSQPGFKDKDELEQFEDFIDAGVSKENAGEYAKIKGQKLSREQEGFEKSYKAQEDFIKDTTKRYQAFETETKPKLLQMQKIASDEQLVSPTAAAFLEHMGIPLGALEDPSSELYNKLSKDLLKGLPETYGNKIMKVEVENFLQTIPTLLNSADGRRMIASNMLKLGEMKEVFYNSMRRQQQDALDNNKPLPRDFEQRVFDQVKPQIDRMNNEFVKLSTIKSVPEGETPYFSSDGEIYFVPKSKDWIEWANEQGMRKVW